MSTQTLERPATESSVETQKFRIKSIVRSKSFFVVKYQIANGIEWEEPSSYNIKPSLVQTAFNFDALKSAIKRVFSAESWSDSAIEINGLVLTYAGLDDKPKPGLEERKPGDLVKVEFSHSYQSQYTHSEKPIKSSPFEQIVDAEMVGEMGFLDESELRALQGIIDEIGRELARELNSRPLFTQMKLKLV
jgi:hypothetical protein